MAPTHGRELWTPRARSLPLPQRHSLRDREALLFVVPCVLLPERGLEEEAVPLTASTQSHPLRWWRGPARARACCRPATPRRGLGASLPVALPMGAEAGEVGMLLLWLVGLLPISWSACWSPRF